MTVIAFHIYKVILMERIDCHLLKLSHKVLLMGRDDCHLLVVSFIKYYLWNAMTVIC